MMIQKYPHQKSIDSLECAQAEFTSLYGKFMVVITQSNLDLYKLMTDNFGENKNLKTVFIYSIIELIYKSLFRCVKNLELIHINLNYDTTHLRNTENDTSCKWFFVIPELSIGKICISTDKDTLRILQDCLEEELYKLKLVNSVDKHIAFNLLINKDKCYFKSQPFLFNAGRSAIGYLKINGFYEGVEFNCYLSKQLYKYMLSWLLNISIDMQEETKLYSRFNINLLINMLSTQLKISAKPESQNILFRYACVVNYIPSSCMIINCYHMRHQLGYLLLDTWQFIPSKAVKKHFNVINREEQFKFPISIGEAVLDLNQIKNLQINDVIMLNTKLSQKMPLNLIIGSEKIQLIFDQTKSRLNVL